MSDQSPQHEKTELANEEGRTCYDSHGTQAVPGLREIGNTQDGTDADILT